MSFGGGGTDTTTTSVDVPAWYQQAQQGNVARAGQVANRPYEMYGGPRIADWTQDQQNSFDLQRGMVGQSNQGYDQAAQYMQQGGQAIRPPGTQSPQHDPLAGGMGAGFPGGPPIGGQAPQAAAAGAQYMQGLDAPGGGPPPTFGQNNGHLPPGIDGLHGGPAPLGGGSPPPMPQTGGFPEIGRSAVMPEGWKEGDPNPFAGGGAGGLMKAGGNGPVDYEVPTTGHLPPGLSGITSAGPGPVTGGGGQFTQVPSVLPGGATLPDERGGISYGTVPPEPRIPDERGGEGWNPGPGGQTPQPQTPGNPWEYSAAMMGSADPGAARGYQAAGPAPTRDAQMGAFDMMRGYAAGGPAQVANIQGGQLGRAADYAASMGSLAQGGARNGADFMANYDNPHQTRVIDRAMDDIDRQETRDLSQARRRAAGAEAFGGSRSAIMEGEIGRNFNDMRGDVISNLRQQGYDTALQAGQTDAERNAGMSQFNANQSQGLSERNADRMTDASRYAAEMGNQFAMQQAGFDQQAGMGNAAARNAALMDFTQRGDASSRSISDAWNQTQGLRANLGQQVNMQNAGATNASLMDYAGRSDGSGRHMADASNQNNQFRAQLSQDAAGRNQDAMNMARRFGMETFLGAENMNRQNASRAGDQMAGLANMRRGSNNEDVDRLFQIGEMERGLRQRGMDTAYGDYNRQRQHDIDGLQMMIGALSGVPQGMFGTTTTAPSQDRTGGMLGSLGSLASGIGSLAAFSDRRLKTNAQSLGGGLYEFGYIWDPGTRHVGVMSDEIDPRYVIRGMSGFDMVNYDLMALEA